MFPSLEYKRQELKDAAMSNLMMLGNQLKIKGKEQQPKRLPRNSRNIRSIALPTMTALASNNLSYMPSPARGDLSINEDVSNLLSDLMIGEGNNMHSKLGNDPKTYTLKRKPMNLKLNIGGTDKILP